MSHTNALSLALSRIGKAAGIAPIALLPLLAACEADQAPIAAPASSDHAAASNDLVPADSVVVANGATPGEGNALDSDVPQADGGALEALRPAIWLHTEIIPGHIAEFEVSFAPARSTITLFMGRPGGITPVEGAELNIANAVALTTVDAGADGSDVVRVLIPDAAANAAPDGTELVVQALVVTESGSVVLSNVRTTATTEVVADRAGFSELHPDFDIDAIVAGERARACVPADLYGDCPVVADFNDWQALEVVSFALDRNLPAHLSADACIEENAFVDSCCYVVEFFEIGQTTDTCVRPNAGNNGGGGGGGGGGGWGYDGRPFETSTGRREAPVQVNHNWSTVPDLTIDLPEALRATVLAAWTATARAEHASVASFSRFTLELMALGAPADLVAWATRAQADEIRHAQVAFGVASALSEAPVGPGAFRIEGALDRSTDVEAVLTSAIVEGCIMETIASLQVRDAADHAVDPALKAMLTQVAIDELSHAELSWAFVRWMLSERPELADVARAAFAGFEPPTTHAPDGVDLSAWGVRPLSANHALANDAWSRVILPAAQALLDGPSVGEA